MSWKQTTLDFLGDALRFIGRAGLLVNIILISLWSVWFCARFLWQLMGYVRRSLFSAPW